MSFNYNHITIVGRLTADPEIKTIGETLRSTFRVAVSRPYRKEDGTAETDFIPVQMWGKLAEISKRFLEKGSPVLIEGRLQVRTYEQKEEKKWFVEVVAENFQILESLKKQTESKLAA